MTLQICIHGYQFTDIFEHVIHDKIESVQLAITLELLLSFFGPLTTRDRMKGGGGGEGGGLFLSSGFQFPSLR